MTYAQSQKAKAALADYTQCDPEGVMVIAFRQAIDEVLAYVEQLEAECFKFSVENLGLSMAGRR